MAIENENPKKTKDAIQKTRAKLEQVVEELNCAVEKANDHLEKKVEECLQGFTLMQQQRDLSISLASASDLTAGLQVSLDAGVQVSGMDCGGIYLFDKEGGSLNLVVHQGLCEEFIRIISHYDEGSENTQIVKAGEPVYILHKDLNVPKSPTEEIEGLRMFSMLPLVDDGKVIGCMNLGSHTEEDVPAAGRIAIETTAAQIGSALSRLKTREALAENEGHLRSLMNSATNFAIYGLRADEQNPHSLRVEYVSPSMGEILGIPEPMKFETWFEHMHPDDVDRIAEANSKAFETLRFDEQYRCYNHKIGQWRWIHAISTGVIGKNGWDGYVNGIMVDITEHKLIEEKLKQNEIELKLRTRNLEETNTALKVVIKSRENDRAELEDKILSNVNSTIIPYLEKLKQRKQDADGKAWLKIIELNLNEITSSFSKNLSSNHIGLTPTEIRVANLIKLGYTTKEIANQMNVSPKTTSIHRSTIRKKLGIAGPPYCPWGKETAILPPLYPNAAPLLKCSPGGNVTISSKDLYLLIYFERLNAIKSLLRKIDPSIGREVFEREYEKLLDGFYSELLEIDEMIGRDVPSEAQFVDRLKSLIEAGRRFDNLWDTYHSERLDLVQFSKLLG